MAKEKQRRAFDSVKDFSTTVGVGSSVDGDIRGKDNCLVLGQGSGRCVIDGSVVIGAGAVWKGTIDADNVMVAGQVEGDVTARNQLEVLATARVTGSLCCPRIAIADGAVHSGEIVMGRPGGVTHFNERRTETTGTGSS